MDRMDKASQSNVVIKLWSYYNRTPYVSSPSSLTRENVVARLIAAAASTLPYPATFALSHTMWAVVAFLVFPSSLSLSLCGEEEGCYRYGAGEVACRDSCV